MTRGLVMKAGRNKTIDFTVEEGREYLEKCISINSTVSLDDIINTTILGDSFTIMPFLPENFVDLLIVDPPYNIDKDFNGNRFKRITENAYEEYSEAWVKATLPLLKENATIYVCCDWKSSPIIGSVLKKYFHIRNRITWQREKGRGAQYNWKNSLEDIWFATVSEQYTFNVENVKIRRKVIAPYKVDGKPKDWEETVMLPFEDAMLCAPKGYDAILRHQYGDYMQIPEDKATHDVYHFDPDVPYTEYFGRK